MIITLECALYKWSGIPRIDYMFFIEEDYKIEYQYYLDDNTYKFIIDSNHNKDIPLPVLKDLTEEELFQLSTAWDYTFSIELLTAIQEYCFGVVLRDSRSNISFKTTLEY